MRRSVALDSNSRPLPTASWCPISPRLPGRRRGGAVCHLAEVHAPVGLPGCPGIVGEGLLPACRDGVSLVQAKRTFTRRPPTTSSQVKLRSVTVPGGCWLGGRVPFLLAPMPPRVMAGSWHAAGCRPPGPGMSRPAWPPLHPAQRCQGRAGCRAASRPLSAERERDAVEAGEVSDG